MKIFFLKTTFYLKRKTVILQGQRRYRQIIGGIKMKCALVGWGYWGKIVERYIRGNETFTIKYIYDPHISAELEFHTILDDNEIECVFVCTPINTHYQVVKDLINHGKHVFCEKPLCNRVTEIDELYHIAYKKNVCIYTDYIYTNSMAINYLKDNIEQIGNIKYVNARIKQFGNFYREDNCYEVIGVHMISAIIYILEKYNMDLLDIVSIHNIRINSNSNKVSAGIINFILDRQITGQIECSLVSSNKVRTLEFIGEKGNIVFDMLSDNTIKMTLVEEDDYRYSIVEKNIYFDETNNLRYAISAFAEEVKAEVRNNIKLSLRVTQILEKLKY